MKDVVLRVGVVVGLGLFLFTARGEATTGGPTTVAILGFDASDDKLFFMVEYDDASGRLPQVFFMPTKGARIGRSVAVRSYYRDGYHTSDGESYFTERLDHLKKRLVPLSRLSPSGFSVHRRTSSCDRFRLFPGTDDGTILRCQFEVGVREKRAPLRSGRIELTSYHRRRISLKGVYEISGQPWALGIVSHVGIPHEGGYTKQIALLLRRPASTP